MIDALLKKITPQLEQEGWNWETVESQREQTNRSLRDLTQFLALVSFIALLLGCIGVASAIHIYVREKISTVAILRCLGAQGRQAFAIYLLQIVVIGAIGSIVGAVLGTVIQQFLPAVLKDFLPVTITTAVSWKAIAQGLGVGIIISALFALLPLISIRNVSPLNTLRLSFQQRPVLKDRLKWLVYLLILLFVFGFSWLQLGNWRSALSFSASIVVAFLILSGIAVLLMRTVRRFFPGSWPYTGRQGLANLFRPNNQTTTLIVAIGLGTAFICTLFSIQALLLNRVRRRPAATSPIRYCSIFSRRSGRRVVALAQQHQLPIQGTVPIVNDAAGTHQCHNSRSLAARQHAADAEVGVQPGVPRYVPRYPEHIGKSNQRQMAGHGRRPFRYDIYFAGRTLCRTQQHSCWRHHAF
jgi:putative ABC transport system permease protein